MEVDAEVSPLLRELWRSRAKVLATGVASSVREHREIAHAAALISEDYHDRFLIELIQNANDQAVLGGTIDSTVLVIRSEQFVAVSNAGQVVTQRNLERISSLADSDKTGLLVGNKGVGFKAVYQVTDTPEVYSAPDSEGVGVFNHLAIGFALERTPFDDEGLRNAVEEDVRAFFAENHGLARQMEDAGYVDPVVAVRPELTQVAGFKFPLPRSAQDLATRAAALQIPAHLRAGVRTLVVLPLRDGTARATAEKTIDLLVGVTGGKRAQAELATLFLGGIGELIVIDRVRGEEWSFSCLSEPDAEGLQQATVTVQHGESSTEQTKYWLLRSDVFDCDAEVAAERHRIVSEALEKFGLEAWSPEDPLPVTIALPKPLPGRVGPLGAPGWFCLGLPTEQSTGLPAHVDARFFAKINRDGVNFNQKEGYNGLLLDVATEVFGRLLACLRASESLDTRRAATLALHRPEGEPGALAERVYAQGGVADGEVVLAWDGLGYRQRSECLVPFAEERDLIPLLDSALSRAPAGTGSLPEQGLVMHALDELVSMGIDMLGDLNPHPWLARSGGGRSIIEEAAQLHRADGADWWEGFVEALLGAFPRLHEVEELRVQRWVPTGAADLSMPQARVFLPAPTDSSADEEEVTDVPPRVAASLRLVDASKLRLREDGRALTPLASRLADAKLVRRPRKTELLEEALFPALVDAVGVDDEPLALDLFAQAVAWIASMKEASRKRLQVGKALVPVVVDGRVLWLRPSEAYLGEDWGLDSEHERLLQAAYPNQRIVPLGALTPRFGSAKVEQTGAREAATVLGVLDRPRIINVPRGKSRPLRSLHLKLSVVGTPSLGRPELDPIYRSYLDAVARIDTPWDWPFDHDVDEVAWIDGLEDATRRPHVLDLMLVHAEAYANRTTTNLRRVGHNPIKTVRQLWAFALATEGWPIFAVERGAGGEADRVPASDAWLLADGSRRTAFAKLVNVVPQAHAPAWPLLQKFGVWTIETAPASRLVQGLRALATRLEPEHLDVHRDALSLARELYSQIEDRAGASVRTFPPSAALPLLRHGRLVAVTPEDDGTTVLFDDDPGRSKHIPGAASAYRVPVGRDAKIDKLHAMFVASWGGSRVIRASAAAVDLGFSAAGDAPQSFLAWLQRSLPHTEVAVELAVLLTLGGDRTLRAERVSRNWRLFRELEIVFGSFESASIQSFYDRPRSRLLLAGGLKDDPPSVVAATWEVAGVRARDLWDGYARAVRESATGAFLREREITAVEIIDVADAAGLHRSQTIDGVECALLAAFLHLGHGEHLNDAASWWARVDRTSQAVADALGRPDLAAEIDRAVALPQPEGEVHLVRVLGVAWSDWQAAVVRRDGRIFRFERTVARFRHALVHLAAVVRELAARTGGADLDSIGSVLEGSLEEEAPDDLAGVPVDDADADSAALNALISRLEGHDAIRDGLLRLAEPPWVGEFPVPDPGGKATKRGVLLYRDQPVTSRAVEAQSTIAAVLEVASALAPRFGEHLGPEVTASSTAVARLTVGAWANVYAALAALREVLAETAPLTTARLSDARAFHGPTRAEPLTARLPELVKERKTKPPPTREVLGVELTDMQLRDDLAAGSSGAIGAKLAKSAAQGVPSGLLSATRTPLPEPTRSGPTLGGGGKRGSGGAGKPAREPELVGDLGEAFVHEWLTHALGEHYGPECWKSKARERYGLPASGNDGFGYDFEVADSAGRLFGREAATLLIEVKSTRTDGSGPFPMSRGEWDRARRSHEAQDGTLYVIVRVFHADSEPCIGDVLLDPFAAHRRGEVRLAERDLWVKVAAPELVLVEESIGDGGEGRC